ncbi:hypothetical protein [Corallococcus aberystwythensis]|uniref:Lipoprotein n=1 Tax=Corallococcus aberystwythensis TaxID=2316722 RepID=A0A3A8QDR9_9BACT|nr:hypothetical protein [Corallococcus aberystwythensis]RKH66756.1 hypothetical protein D7W81_14990 [Corallococcus aberystwythensis]
MTPPRWMWWLCCLLWTACAGPEVRAPRSYSQATMDSATAGCLRNPACASQVGQDAILPWLSRAAARAGQAAAVMRLWEAAEVDRVERVLAECAKQANFEVNERLLGPGKRTNRQVCEEKVVDANGREITRAVQLGEAKHAAALECVQRALGATDAGRFSLEPRYLRDAKTGRTRWLEPEEVAQWLRDGLFHLLTGTIAPDVVLHALGNPLKVQRVYDFKFPCPVSNIPRWDPYPDGHLFASKNQGEIYQQLLKSEQVPQLVSPNHGVTP